MSNQNPVNPLPKNRKSNAGRIARTKPEVALAEIDRVIAAGVRFGCVLADARYGLSAPFRQGLTARKRAGQCDLAGKPSQSAAALLLQQNQFWLWVEQLTALLCSRVSVKSRHLPNQTALKSRYRSAGVCIGFVFEAIVEREDQRYPRRW